MLASHALSVMLLVPALGGVAALAFPDRLWVRARATAVAVALAELALGVWLLWGWRGAAGFQVVEKAAWVPHYGVSYHLGVDGLSLSLVLLTVFLTPLALMVPFDGLPRHRSAFFASVLFLEAGMLGVFVSLDLVLFYLFWEVMLLPAYFIVGLWGGERRIQAAIRFFIYTLAGSLLMLAGIILLWNAHLSAVGTGTFSIPGLAGSRLPGGLQTAVFLLFFAAFAVKTPLVPFHSWLPPAYHEAPTAGSLLMSAVMAKMGIYGFLRVCLPLFPEAARTFAPWAAGLALAGIVYGAWLALAQDDVKRLVAWSSVSHLGFIALGVFSLNQRALAGASLQMVGHGLTVTALFALAAHLQRRAGTRSIPSLNGFARGLPRLGAALVFFSLAGMGLPGLATFVGEFLIVSGALKWRLAAGFLSVAGLVLGALYMLRLAGRLVWSEGPGPRPHVRDLSPGETVVLFPLAAGLLWLGVAPGSLIEVLRPSLEAILRMAGGM